MALVFRWEGKRKGEERSGLGGFLGEEGVSVLHC